MTPVAKSKTPPWKGTDAHGCEQRAAAKTPKEQQHLAAWLSGWSGSHHVALARIGHRRLNKTNNSLCYQNPAISSDLVPIVFETQNWTYLPLWNVLFIPHACFNQQFATDKIPKKKHDILFTTMKQSFIDFSVSLRIHLKKKKKLSSCKIIKMKNSLLFCMSAYSLSHQIYWANLYSSVFGKCSFVYEQAFTFQPCRWRYNNWHRNKARKKTQWGVWGVDGKQLLITIKYGRGTEQQSLMIKNSNKNTHTQKKAKP